MNSAEYQIEKLPYKVAVLCYLWDPQGRVLMLHRKKQPNMGLCSPIGGKLEISQGEGPHECAIREISEEAGITLASEDVRCLGVVSEKGYQGQTHWLIFLFETTRTIDPSLIPEQEFDEGRLEWVPLSDVEQRNIPWTDRHIMWPAVRRHKNGGFFMVHIDCTAQPPRHVLCESAPPGAVVK